MWDAITELDPTIDKDSYIGDLLLIFVDDTLPCDVALVGILERRFAAAPGGRDLRFSFAYLSDHDAHFERFRIKETPAAVYVRESIELDRCDSVEDVIAMAREVIARYK